MVCPQALGFNIANKLATQGKCSGEMNMFS